MKRYQALCFFMIIAMVFSFASVPVVDVSAAAQPQAALQTAQKPVQSALPITRASTLPGYDCSLLTNPNNGLDPTTLYQLALSCPTTDLYMQKIADVRYINVGDTIGFSVSVTNVGSSTQTHVILGDKLKPGLVWQFDNNACSIDSTGNLLCNVGDLQPGYSFRVHIQAVSTAVVCGKLWNLAMAESDQIMAAASQTWVHITCNPNVTVNKVPENRTITAGQTARYTIEVKSIGTDIAQGVTVADTLPSGYTWSIDSQTTAGACAIANGVLSCSYASMPIGDVQNVVISAPTSAAVCGGEISNTVTVAATNEAVTEQGDNTSTATIGVICSTLKVEKTADAAHVFANDPIGYNLVVTNTGTTTATGVTLTDTLPSGVAWSSNNALCTITGETTSVMNCTFGDLVGGATASVHLTAQSNASVCGDMSNTASASATNISGVVTSSATISIQCQPNVTVTKVPEVNTIVPGDTARYTIKVSSYGTGDAQGVVLEDTLPTTPGTNWTIDNTANGSACSITAGVLTCNFGTIPSGSDRTVVISTPTTADSCGSINNTAVVTATNEAVAQASDNSSSATVTVNCTSLKVEKLADAARINANDPIGFTIKVTNTGLNTANNVRLTDSLPTGVAWTADNTACSVDNSNVLTCNFGNLAANGFATVHVGGTSSTAICGTVVNTAIAQASNITGTSSGSASVVVVCGPVITVQKIAENSEVAAGNPVRFNIIVTNTGGGPADNVTITDTLPVGTLPTWTFDNVSTGGNCAISNGELNCSFGTLVAGATASVRVSANTSSQTCTTVINTVVAQATNVDTATDSAKATIICNANVKVTKTAENATITAGDATKPARFIITVTSNGTDPATDVRLADPLPTFNDLSWTIDSVTGGGACAISGTTLKCTFGTLSNGQVRTVVISSPTSSTLFCVRNAERTITNTAIVTSTNEPLSNLGDNNASAQINVNCGGFDTCTAPNETYTNNFNSNTPGPAHWSKYKISTSPNRTQTFLGDFGPEDLRFNYADTNLTGHFAIEVSFDLYILRSWDGNVTYLGTRTVGPDHFYLSVLDDNQNMLRSLLDTTFTNNDEPTHSVFTQAYPENYPTGQFKPMTGARAINTMGYMWDGPKDSIYHITYLIPHTNPNIHLNFSAAGLYILSDESWGIDNFLMTILRCSSGFTQQFSTYLPFLVQGTGSVASPAAPMDVNTNKSIPTPTR